TRERSYTSGRPQWQGRAWDRRHIMPLTKMPLPSDLLSFANNTVSLNRERYAELRFVEGEPPLSTPGSSLREAFVALEVAKRRASQGESQFVYLGDRAVQFLYGRPKRDGEKDCDVVSRVLQGQTYGYLLAEGKGANIADALTQLETAKECIGGR